MANELDLLPDMITIPELVKFLRISRAAGYELARSANFPAIRIGKSVRVPKKLFIEWLKNNLSGRENTLKQEYISCLPGRGKGGKTNWQRAASKR